MIASAFPTRAAIEADQLAKLRALLTAILPANSFYAAKFAAAGVTAAVASLAEFRDRVPLTRKPEVIEDQRAHRPYGSNLTYPLARYTRFTQTSGTTGTPMRWLDTRESWDWMLSVWDEVYRAAEVTANDRIFFAFSFGPFLGFWTAFEAATRMGALAIPGGGMRSAARLRTLIDIGATVLCCTPTYAIRLAEVAAEEKIDLAAAKLRRIIVAGEAGGSIAGTRAAIEDFWRGARVVDQHGMTETGPVSYGCPARPGLLHVVESSFIAEIVDPVTGLPAAPGSTGELVLTNLGRIGSPLIRYRTGDMVKPVPACACACGTCDLALDGGILGRTDDMVVVRGVNVYPSAVEDILRAAGGIAEYRVEVRSHRALSELSIQVEPLPGGDGGGSLAHRLEAALTGAFSLRIPVSLAPPGTLPRFEMKAQRWVRV